MNTTTSWMPKKDNNSGRYVIVDANNGCILDDAQGYGFSDYQKAYRYGLNRFKCESCIKEKLPESMPLF